MDKPIKHINKTKKQIIIVSILVTTVLIISSYLLNIKKSANVNLNNIIISKVENGVFKETISFTAITEPSLSENIAAIEGGKVKSIYVNNGDSVKTGDTLLILKNEELVLEYMNKESHLVEQLNTLRSSKINLQHDLRLGQEKLIDLNYDYKIAMQKYSQDSILWFSKAISKNEYVLSLEKLNYLKKKIEFTNSSITLKELSLKTELVNINQSIELINKNLKALKIHLKSLTIVASTNGIISEFDYNIGESISKNQIIAKCSNHKNYNAYANIDEHYLSRFKTGLKGIYELNGNAIRLEVRKIHQEVISNRFRVDLKILNQHELNLTNGQSLYVKLPINDKRNAKFISKGDFYSTTGGNWIFVLNGNEGVKRNIKIGKQNSKYYEILEGLNVGEDVITSSYNQFENVEIVYLNEE